MNPFHHIATTLAGRNSPWSIAKPNEAEPKQASKTERMRRYLREHGPANCYTLAMEADVPSVCFVGALLKNDLHKGSIFKRGDRYVWNPQWDQEAQAEIRKAKALLRRHGYEVRKLA